MTASIADSNGGIGRVGVVGSATIVAGIVQTLAEAGLRVIVFSDNVAALEKSLAFARQMIERKLAKGNLSPSQAESACASMEAAENIAGLRHCDLVIESLLSAPQNTRTLVAQLEAVLRPDAIIALNTSSHTVTALARDAGRPQQIAGMHFFEPVPLMRVVEVIPGLRTADAVITGLSALVRRIGHRAIAVKDSPGFVVNHIGRALLTEGLCIVSEQIAPVSTVDRIVRESLGLRMGPFELMDLIGVDVSQPVSEQIYHDFHEESRLRPTPLLEMQVAAGLLGRKTGQGFYNYGAETQWTESAFPMHTPSAVVEPTLWCDSSDPALYECLLAHLAKASAVVDDGARPSASSLCLVTPSGEDATHTALRLGLDPSRTVAVDVLSGLSGHTTLMGSLAISAASRDSVLSVFSRAGSVSWIEDSPGFVAQRVLAAIVNVACDVAQQGIASPQSIDTAVQIALGYPAGPLTMGDRMGPQRVLQILDRMHSFYGDARYRASPWLRRRAALDVSLATVSATTELAKTV